MKFKIKFFGAISLVLIIIFSVSFVFQINAIAFENKLIQIYDEKLKIAEQENELLIVNSAKKNSLNNIKDSIDIFGFERVDKVHYIKGDDIVVTK